MEIPRGRGVSKAQFLKGKYDTKMEFREGWEGSNIKTFCGRVWIFSGTTQSQRRSGVSKAQFLKVKYDTKMEFCKGCEGSNIKTFRGRGMDIFWNNTIPKT